MPLVSSNPLTNDILDCRAYSQENPTYNSPRNKIPALLLSDDYIALLGLNDDAKNRIINKHLGACLLTDMGMTLPQKELRTAIVLINGKEEVVPALLYEDMYSEYRGDSYLKKWKDKGDFFEDLAKCKPFVQEQIYIMLWHDYLLWNTERTTDTIFATKTQKVVAHDDGSLFDNKPSIGVLKELDDIYMSSPINPSNYFEEPDWSRYQEHRKYNEVKQVQRRFVMMQRVWGG